MASTMAAVSNSTASSYMGVSLYQHTVDVSVAVSARVTMVDSSKLSSTTTARKAESGRLRAVSLTSDKGLSHLLNDKDDTPAVVIRGQYPRECSWHTPGLSVDPESFAKTRALEVIHARWAMLGVVGCMAPEILALQSTSQTSAVWFTPGAELINDASAAYAPHSGTSIFHTALDFLGRVDSFHLETVLAIGFSQVVIMGAIESFRVTGGPLGEASDPIYPGGCFDPLGLADSSHPTELAKMKGRELENGRLAMFSMLAFVVQAVVTGKGPVENLLTHVSDPSAHNVWAYFNQL